jgi:DNA-binding transcriptional MerR regulator
MTVEKDPSLTHALLAKALGVTVTTIKSYRRKFPEFWPPSAKGKPIRFPEESLGLCKRIHHHFKRGLSVDETRKRLAEEFQSFALPPPASQPQKTLPAQPSDTFSRIETLLEGLFTLQNRTHSLLAELVVKLDTFADRVATPARAAAERPSRAEQTPPPTASSKQPGIATPAQVPNSAGKTELLHPPQALMEVPAVVLSDDGEFLGVTMKSGRPLTLSQFTALLISRSDTAGTDQPLWKRHGQEWVLRLKSQGQILEHHFQQAVTPRGNTVARFSSLSSGGQLSPEHSLQALLRQVKDTLDQ